MIKSRNVYNLIPNLTEAVSSLTALEMFACTRVKRATADFLVLGVTFASIGTATVMLVSTSLRIRERALFADEEPSLDIVGVGNLGVYLKACKLSRR
jgi:hypothetical protein